VHSSPQASWIKFCTRFSIPYMLHVLPIPFSLFTHFNIWWGVEIMKLSFCGLL
jgi:hypothetical protein